MSLEPNNNGWHLTWLFGLGAGWAGVLSVVGYHLFYGKPEWLKVLDGSTGWTIYPSLSALPQAIPGREIFPEYLLGALACGGVFLGAWLRAWVQQRRLQSSRPGRRWFWLSLLLLAPVGVHTGGTLYVSYTMCAAEAEMLQEYLKVQAQTPDKELSTDSLEASLDAPE